MPPKIEEDYRDETTCPGRGNREFAGDDGWTKKIEIDTSIEDLDQDTDPVGPLTRR